MNRIKALSKSQIQETKVKDLFNQDKCLPESIFRANDFCFIVISMHDYLFGFDNNHIQENIKEFAKQTSNLTYIVASEFQESSYYRGYQYESHLTLNEVQQNLEEPFGSELGTNWTNDYLFDEDGKWGIYHLHDAFCLIVGYQKILQKLVEETLLKGLTAKSIDLFFDLITESSSVAEKALFITQCIENNRWLTKAKIYLPPV